MVEKAAATNPPPGSGEAMPITGTIDIPNGANVAPLLAFAEKRLQPFPVTLTGDGKRGEAQAIALPTGFTLASVKALLDEYAQRPDRRKGTAEMEDLQSFIDFMNRFKDDHSALFATRGPLVNGERQCKPVLIGVADYHEKTAAGLPRFGQHRALYTFPLSDPWKVWTAKDQEVMSQAEFAEFLENNIADVVAPPDFFHAEFDKDESNLKLKALSDQLGTAWASPSGLLTLSRGLQVNVSSVVKNAQTLQSGEVNLVYQETHNDGAGAPLKVPGVFLICIPVFEFGLAYRMAVRLRYRMSGGFIKWFFQIYRADLTFEDAFKGAVEEARTKTLLPLFIGSAEK